MQALGAGTGGDAGAAGRRRLVLPRALRRPARVLSRLEWQVPRHFGLKLAAGFLALTGFTGMVMGGHTTDVVAAVSVWCGLGIDRVEIKGQSETSEIDVLEWAQVGEHPYIRALGPDPLDAALEVGAVASRLAEPRFAGRALASLLLDQGFLAGIGNYLRAEICFAAGVHPSRRPRDLDSCERARIAAAALALCRRSYETRGITNDPECAARLRREGIPRSRYRFHVFGRSGQPCWQCSAIIERAAIGGRRCYWCPECQPAPDARRLETTA